MAYGEKPDQSPWRVAIKDPRDPEGDYLGAITLEGGEFLSTSGDYERYFMENEKRYHHILDPKTGYPVWNGLTSVTVVCDSGLFADGLSTACFVLGKEKALPLLEKYGADAVFAEEDHKVYLTEGMKERFELMKNTYETEILKQIKKDTPFGLQAYPFCNFPGEKTDQQSGNHAGDQKSRGIIKQACVFYNKGGNDQLADIMGNASGYADAHKTETGEFFHKGHDSKT